MLITIVGHRVFNLLMCKLMIIKMMYKMITNVILYTQN